MPVKRFVCPCGSETDWNKEHLFSVLQKLIKDGFLGRITLYLKMFGKVFLIQPHRVPTHLHEWTKECDTHTWNNSFWRNSVSLLLDYHGHVTLMICTLCIVCSGLCFVFLCGPQQESQLMNIPVLLTIDNTISQCTMVHCGWEIRELTQMTNESRYKDAPRNRIGHEPRPCLVSRGPIIALFAGKKRSGDLSSTGLFPSGFECFFFFHLSDKSQMYWVTSDCGGSLNQTRTGSPSDPVCCFHDSGEVGSTLPDWGLVFFVAFSFLNLGTMRNMLLRLFLLP